MSDVLLLSNPRLYLSFNKSRMRTFFLTVKHYLCHLYIINCYEVEWLSNVHFWLHQWSNAYGHWEQLYWYFGNFAQRLRLLKDQNNVWIALHVKQSQCRAWLCRFNSTKFMLLTSDGERINVHGSLHLIISCPKTSTICANVASIRLSEYQTRFFNVFVSVCLV